MKAILGVLASVVLISGVLAAQDAHTKYTVTYGDVAWGSSGQAVTQRLSELGFAFKKVDEDGDYLFEGKALGYPAGIWALMVPRYGVGKIIVAILTPDQHCRETYRDMKQTLTAKYGQAKQSFEYFSEPYYEGDGYEDQAIKIGKGHFATFWDNGLELSITERLTLDVEYESPAWHDEAERRKSKSTRAF